MCDSKGRKQFLTGNHDDHMVVSLNHGDWYVELRISDGDDEIRLYIGDSEEEKKSGLEMVCVLRKFLTEFKAAIEAKGKVTE